MAAVLLLAACGSSDDTTAPADAAPGTTSGTLAPPGDGGLRAPTPIEVQSSGAAGNSAGSATAPAVAGDVASSEMRIAPWVAEYVVGDGMPSLPTDDTGWVFETAADLTVEQVAAVAAALGVSGEPVRIDEGFGVNWRVGPDDGSAPSVWVYDDGQQSWNYNAAWGDGAVGTACAVSVDAAGNESRDCPEPEPPVGVPSAGEAEARAGEILTALGVDPSTVGFETFADEWSASVNVADQIDPRAAVRNWYFGFGAEGVLHYAGGSLATAAPVGPYPLIGLDAAIDRLSDGFFGGFGGVGGGIALAEPAAEAVTVEPTEGAPVPVDDGVVGEISEPLPVDPEAVVVTLVDVRADLWWAWDSDGVAWLLPAYRFIDADGGWHVAPAVTDEFLVIAEPIDVPIPVEPDGGDGSTPLPPPESLPVESLPVDEAPDAVDVTPGPDPEVALPMLEEFVGLSTEEFTAAAKELGFSTRVVERDGEALAGTADFRTDRVNVVVEGPAVVEIRSIG